MIWAKWQYSGEAKVALVRGFRKIERRLAACLEIRDSAMKLQAQRIWGHRALVVALGVCIRARKKDSLLTVESRLRLFGSVSSERGWDSKNRRRGSWFTHRDGAFSSKPVKALGDDRLWELANGQGDPSRRCRFTTSWKAIPGVRLIFLVSLRCVPRRRWSRGAQSGVDFLANNKFDWSANSSTTDRSSAFREVLTAALFPSDVFQSFENTVSRASIVSVCRIRVDDEEKLFPDRVTNKIFFDI